ncbi:MAG: CAP domain-containing protein [Actinomycetota bacterium]|nr:CAP domain-containing protein [Actinomycetota bacterium]
MIRRLTLIALTTALLIATTGGTASATHYHHLLAPSTSCPNQTNASLTTTDQETAMRCMHNYARAKVGRSALRSNSLVANSSDGKSYDILRCQAFSHTACGRSMLYHFKRVGYTSCSTWRAAENIAWGSGSYGTVRSRMSGWLHSDGHRKNILSSSYRDLGIGLKKGTFKGYSGAQIWTGHFGYRSGC